MPDQGPRQGHGVETSLRVVVAEDDVLLRAGLASLFDDAGFDVVGQAGDGIKLLALVRDKKPDLVVADIRMPPNQKTEGSTLSARSAMNCPESASCCCRRASTISSTQ